MGDAADCAPPIVCRLGRDCRVERASPACARLLGLAPEEVVGRPIAEVIGAARFARIEGLLARSLAGEAVAFELPPTAAAGAAASRLRVCGVPDFDDDGHVRGVVLVATDAGGAGSGDARLHSVLVANMAEGVSLVRIADQKIVYTNPKLDRMLGYAPGELLGRPVSVMRFEGDAARAPAPDVQAIDEELRESGEASFEVKTVRKDGTWIWCRARVSSFEHAELGAVWVTVHEDITERKQLEAKLRLGDRMASLGTLAAGIAHEINNPLAYVISNLEMIGDEVRALSESSSPPARLRELREMTADAHDGAERVRSVVRLLRSFARPEEHPRRPLDVRAVLETAIALAQGEVERRARLTREYADVPAVEGDEGQLGQVFVDLLLNAARAIPPGRADDHRIRVVLRPDASGAVFVEIADTGVGIAPELLGRIFDPFFTTKPVGGGPGLGLSVCHSVVTALGGRIDVESTVGKGSAFRVVLPAAGPAPAVTAPGAAPDAPEDEAASPGRRRGRVLVVDDDLLVATTIRRVFGREHDVTLATNGREALDLICSGSDFDAIVCDLMMPTMTGMDLFAELRRLHPGVCERVVFITGGAFTPAARAFLERVTNPRVEKPFAPDVLRALIRELVHRGGAPSLVSRA